MAKQNDPWLMNSDGTLDPFANNVDWGANSADLKDPDLLLEDEPIVPTDPVLDQHQGLQPEIVVRRNTPEPEPEPEPVVVPDPDEPETMTLEDGTELTIEKERGQWKGTVASPTGGNPQVYWGKTLKELIFTTLKAQANATKKIREQNAELKFGRTPKSPTPAPATPQLTPVRKLTADEIFEYRTLQESDPVAAQDFLLLKTRGVTMDQLVSLTQQAAQKGEYASNQLISEAVNNTFLANNPDYYPDNNAHNHRQLIRWIMKFKLGENISLENAYKVFDRLISTGNYTVENLEEAFQDLTADGLMLQAPKLPKASQNAKTPPPVAVQHNEPAPAPRPDPRIVSQVVRPRAALGIKQNDVTPVKPPEPNAPSAEDFESMTDEQVREALNGVRRLRLQNRR